MNDERLGKEIGAFYRETDVTPPDPQESARQIAARLARTPQVKPRRWLPAWRFRPTRPLDTDPATEHQPTHVPVTNGHAPTATGRTRLMFSPVKAITAGALVFALGGLFLVAQPFDRQSSVPGAEQGAEPAPPVRVTGETLDRRCEPEPDPEVDGPVERWYGPACEALKEWSDPRLAGTDVYANNATLYNLADGDGLGIYHDVHDIVTDDGAWRMRPQIRFEFPGTGDISDFPVWWVLDGEGAHEGLSLLLFRSEGEPLTGYIVSTDLLPPVPERASPE